MELTKELYENSVKFFEESLKAATLDENFCIKVEGFKPHEIKQLTYPYAYLKMLQKEKLTFATTFWKHFFPLLI